MSPGRQRLIKVGIVVAVVGICVGLVWAGVSKLAAARAQLEILQHKIGRLDEANRRLYRRLQRLRHDRQAIEKACRYEMGWVRPGEVVYVLGPEGPSTGEGVNAVKGR